MRQNNIHHQQKGVLLMIMPFKLKNVGTTYQRMMNAVSSKQIKKSIEVYVDDILIKSNEPQQHQKDLKETFKTLRRYNMRLNAKKCAFGIKFGKFLRFMLTKWGIEANPTKCRVIIDIKSLTNVKKVQALNGRLTALTRFISKSADNLAHFFIHLKITKPLNGLTNVKRPSKGWKST